MEGRGERKRPAQRGGRENERRVNRMIENRQRNQDVFSRVSSAVLPRSAALFSSVFSLPFGRCGLCLCVHIVNTLSSFLPPTSPLTRPTVTNLFQLHTVLGTLLFLSPSSLVSRLPFYTPPPSRHHSRVSCIT